MPHPVPVLRSAVAGPAVASGPVAHTLEVGPTFWLAMFAASAFGTNLGDFWVDALALGRVASSLSLAILCVAAIVADRRFRPRAEWAYWLAIVTLRATATDWADTLTHDLGFGYPFVASSLGALTLAAAVATRAGEAAEAPRIDSRYWAAMLLAGLFGTVTGDFCSELFGLPVAAFVLCVAALAIVVARARFARHSIMAFWFAVAAERCAGTPAGDWLAAQEGVGLALTGAMACTGGLLAAVLAFRAASAARAA